MRNTITRKLVESTIHGYSIEIANGEPTVTKLDPVIVYGKISKENATKLLNKVYGKDRAITVSKIDEEEKQFEITVEDFVKYAKVVTDSDETTDDSDEPTDVFAIGYEAEEN